MALHTGKIFLCRSCSCLNSTRWSGMGRSSRGGAETGDGQREEQRQGRGRGEQVVESQREGQRQGDCDVCCDLFGESDTYSFNCFTKDENEVQFYLSSKWHVRDSDFTITVTRNGAAYNVGMRMIAQEVAQTIGGQYIMDELLSVSIIMLTFNF